jgi:membrane protein
MKFLIRFCRFLITQGKQNNIMNLSAQIAYRMLSAFIPFLMLLYNFVNWFSAGVNETIVFFLSRILPPSMMAYVNLAIENASAVSFSWGTNLILLFFALYVSVSAMHALIIALNRIFGQAETRGTVTLWLQAVIYLFLFLIIIFLTFFFYLFGEKLFFVIADVFDLSGLFILLTTLFSLIYVLMVPTLIFTLIYMFAPKNRLSFLVALPGGIFVSTGWSVILTLYGIYANSALDLGNFFFNLQGPFSLFFSVYLIALTLTAGGLVSLYAASRTTLNKGGKESA